MGARVRAWFMGMRGALTLAGVVLLVAAAWLIFRTPRSEEKPAPSARASETAILIDTPISDWGKPEALAKPWSEDAADTLKGDRLLVDRSLPYLSASCRALDGTVYAALVEYATLVLKPEWIESEDDIFAYFEKRAALIKLLCESEAVCRFLGGQIDIERDERTGEWKRYDRDLKRIGILTFYAEGMLAGFTDYPILADVFARVASEPCRLYIRMKEKYAESHGGEYTYMDLEPEMETICIGEELLQRFTDSKYAEPARGLLSDALYPLTDFHKAGDIMIVGGLLTRAFPTWTDISQPRTFIERYPKSRFRDVVSRIVADPSEVGDEDVQAIIVDVFPDVESARKKVLAYLFQGLDIPHVLTIISNDGATAYATVYRFFSDQEKAKKALDEIRKVKPQAFIRVPYRRSYLQDGILPNSRSTS